MSLAHMVYSTCTSVQNVKIIVTKFMEIIINKNRLLANNIYHNIGTFGFPFLETDAEDEPFAKGEQESDQVQYMFTTAKN